MQKDEISNPLFFPYPLELHMKPYSILGAVAHFAALFILTAGLTAGVHAQTTYKSDRPCGGPNMLTCPGGTICVDDPSDQCDPTKDGAKCMGVCVAGTTTGDVKQPCAGPNGLLCPGGMNCVDDTSDKCDPTKDGAKCPGFCVAGAETGVKRPCAGPNGLTCPGGMICVDDPKDKCDPQEEGAKCPGFCEASTK